MVPGTPTLLLVDGHAYAYRAFHAIRDLRGPDGAATNAIFGFVKMLGRLRGVVSPTHLAVVWDGGLSAERMALVPTYKAQRPAMPDELARQIDELADFLRAAAVRSIRCDGVEADDLIASLVRLGEQHGGRVVIASSDKDFFQMVSASVGLFNPNDKTDTIWSAVQVEDKIGVPPGQVVDWLSLVGDAVDNIPGVPGVGPKTATDLLVRFGSVEQLFARLDEVKSDRLRTALRESAEAVRRNQQMIRLRDDLPVPSSWDGLLAGAPDHGSLLKLYRRWGFKGLAAEVEKLRGGQRDLFGA